MADTSQISSQIYKLLFKIRIKKLGIIPHKGIYYPTQFETFELCISFKNIATSIFPGGKIKDILIESVEGRTLQHSIGKELEIPLLNPGDEKIIKLDKMNTPLYGTLWASGSLIPNVSDGKIETYQGSLNSEEYNVYDINGGVAYNKWGASFFVKSKNEEQQNQTNILILLLTIITTLDGVIGLKTILGWIFFCLRNFFLTIGQLFINIAHILK